MKMLLAASTNENDEYRIVGVPAGPLSLSAASAGLEPQTSRECPCEHLPAP